MKISVIKAGMIDYKDALEMQTRLVEQRRAGLIGDTFLLLEHPPVITVGAGGKRANILATDAELAAEGVSVYDITRGGDVTYHGPGQLVGYPIFDLNGFGKDIHLFVNRIEETFIRLLDREFGITAGRKEKFTGVWVGDDKITAIGIAVKHWVTMHGFAFNVNTQLEHFNWIVPCGIVGKGVTSLEKLLGEKQDMDSVTDLVVQYFCEIFEVEHA
jgi:lipoyl(octanoyl) transferase